MRYLVTGGCGFVGSNLSAEVIKRGEELFVFDNLSRYGSLGNLQWLKQRGSFKFFPSDIRNQNDVEYAIKEIRPDVIFHLAGQVAMTTSIQNPRLDFETNAVGTFNLLEAVRKYSGDSIILYSSTNKVYGDLEEIEYEENETRYVCPKHPEGFDENVPLNFHSPYGCSKGTADQYLLDYYRIYGIKTVVFRHSSMYGSNQYPSYDQGWIGWFCQKAVEIKAKKLVMPLTISGTGKQVRDVLNAEDVVNLYFMAVKNISQSQGQAFNIGGGKNNSLSLIELFILLEEIIKMKITYKCLPWRESDQKVFIANYDKAKESFSWKPKKQYDLGIKETIDWIASSLK